ncbi:hypothetical protein GQ54DRAFT_132635 [Martensiomyces pterosporus]|nr:hypothetical protein GQ54DRAFT_132635 [Martensiomyces pterosporus]
MQHAHIYAYSGMRMAGDSLCFFDKQDMYMHLREMAALAAKRVGHYRQRILQPQSTTAYSKTLRHSGLDRRMEAIHRGMNAPQRQRIADCEPPAQYHALPRRQCRCGLWTEGVVCERDGKGKNKGQEADHVCLIWAGLRKCVER